MAPQIEARCTRKTSTNALQLVFLDRPEDEPLAEALQNGAGGKGAKIGTLFGFKNGGTGVHSVDLRGGTAIRVKSGDLVPTEVTTPEGATVASIERGDDVSIARASGGTEILRFIANPEGAKTLELFRLVIQEPGGNGDVGTLDVIRTSAGWNLFHDLYWELTLWNQAGMPLKIPFLGTRVGLNRDVTDLERDVIIAACTDIAIGLRPYVKEMR
jgi:hypothetical protein